MSIQMPEAEAFDEIALLRLNNVLKRAEQRFDDLVTGDEPITDHSVLSWTDRVFTPGSGWRVVGIDEVSPSRDRYTLRIAPDGPPVQEIFRFTVQP